MAGVLDGVDRRTQLAGQNRLELLLFKLGNRQRFGINVFKVQEVIQCPPLTQVPHSSRVVRGIANMRGRSVSIIDLGAAIGRPATTDTRNSYVIVTEYNRSVQGFLVGSVDRIVNMRWEDILPPPKGSGAHYMTAVTRVDEELVEIIDVEKVLSEVVQINDRISDSLLATEVDSTRNCRILVADDSSVARKQIQRTLEQLGLNATIVSDGRQALQQLQQWAEQGPIENFVDLVISDVEMPEMDGYTLTASIRSDTRLNKLYVILHTSLSGVFNNALVEKVGANEFIPKFNPNDLASAVLFFLQKDKDK